MLKSPETDQLFICLNTGPSEMISDDKAKKNHNSQ